MARPVRPVSADSRDTRHAATFLRQISTVCIFFATDHGYGGPASGVKLREARSRVFLPDLNGIPIVFGTAFELPLPNPQAQKQMMTHALRRLVLVVAVVQIVAPQTAVAQTAPPAAPTNLRIVNGPVASSCPTGQIGTPPNCVPPPPAPAASGKQWTVAFAEEFNGTSLDTTKLTPVLRLELWRLHVLLQHRQGALSVLASADQQRHRQAGRGAALAGVSGQRVLPGACTYKAGLVSTARPRADNGSAYLFAFTYGYIESRMKFPGTPGFFTAFWMLPTDPSFNYRSEIDIVEILGGFPDTIFMTPSLQQSQFVLHAQQRAAQQRRVSGQGLLDRLGEVWTRLAADLRRVVHRWHQVRPVQRQHHDY